eukprot:1366449-Rhodomonas_salina.1
MPAKIVALSNSCWCQCPQFDALAKALDKMNLNNPDEYKKLPVPASFGCVLKDECQTVGESP